LCLLNLVILVVRGLSGVPATLGQILLSYLVHMHSRLRSLRQGQVHVGPITWEVLPQRRCSERGGPRPEFSNSRSRAPISNRIRSMRCLKKSEQHRVAHQVFAAQTTHGHVMRPRLESGEELPVYRASIAPTEAVRTHRRPSRSVRVRSSDHHGVEVAYRQ
jgi:hypothetical protein